MSYILQWLLSSAQLLQLFLIQIPSYTVHTGTISVRYGQKSLIHAYNDNAGQKANFSKKLTTLKLHTCTYYDLGLGLRPSSARVFEWVREDKWPSKYITCPTITTPPPQGNYDNIVVCIVTCKVRKFKWSLTVESRFNQMTYLWTNRLHCYLIWSYEEWLLS